MVARCGTVWTSPNTGHEYLLIGDQMLWFGNQMDHSNLTQIKSVSMVYPCMMTLSLSHSLVSTAMTTSFLCFNTTRMFVYFKTHVLTDQETCNLPIIMLTGEDWDLVNVGLGNGHSRELAEMQMIQSLETGVPKWKMAVMKQCKMDSQVEQWGQVECELSKLSPTLHEKTFCKHLIGSSSLAQRDRHHICHGLDDVITMSARNKEAWL
jgi:hypothetical protein